MLSIIGGLISIAISVMWMLPSIFGNCLEEVLVVIKGAVALGLVFAGLIAIAAGISAIKEKAQEKKNQDAAK